MPQCPVGEGSRSRHQDLGPDFNLHLKRSRLPHKGCRPACIRDRLGRLMVLLDQRALRDQADLEHREETRGLHQDLEGRREETRGHQAVAEEVEVQVDVPSPAGLAEAVVEDREARRDQEVRRDQGGQVARRPRRRHLRLDRTLIGEKWSKPNSVAFA